MQQSRSQLIAAIRPEVQGTISIANNLRNNLNLSILLSSSSAIIGNRGQANSAAVSVFLDTFAIRLTSQQRPTTSIILVFSAWPAENQGRHAVALAHGTRTEDRLLSILEYHMDPRLGAAETSDNCQHEGHLGRVTIHGLSEKVVAGSSLGKESMTQPRASLLHCLRQRLYLTGAKLLACLCRLIEDLTIHVARRFAGLVCWYR